MSFADSAIIPIVFRTKWAVVFRTKSCSYD